MIRERHAAVLAYVRSHPGCTARDVTVCVLRGTGATRSPKRACAYQALRTLEAKGFVVRDKSDNTHRWKAVPN